MVLSILWHTPTAKAVGFFCPTCCADCGINDSAGVTSLIKPTPTDDAPPAPHKEVLRTILRVLFSGWCPTTLSHYTLSFHQQLSGVKDFYRLCRNFTWVHSVYSVQNACSQPAECHTRIQRWFGGVTWRDYSKNRVLCQEKVLVSDKRAVWTSQS